VNAVFPVLISLYAAIPSGIFCIPISRAIAKAGPAAIEAPIAKDSGIVSKPIPISISAPPPFLTAIISAIVKIVVQIKSMVYGNNENIIFKIIFQLF
jgi:hypothetical protein